MPCNTLLVALVLPPWLDDSILSLAQAQNLLIFTTVLSLMVIADRTPVFSKIDKVFSWYPFGILIVLVLASGLGTLTAQKDSGFLNRHQTEEWKGWMQLCILVYHYTGASKVSVIYNFVRVSLEF
jgi:hypothetical protein